MLECCGGLKGGKVLKGSGVGRVARLGIWRPSGDFDGVGNAEVKGHLPRSAICVGFYWLRT